MYKDCISSGILDFYIQGAEMIKKLLPLFLLLLFTLLSVECSNPVENKTERYFPEGKYYYSGFDTAGNLVSQGWFSIVYTDSAHFTGTWQIEKQTTDAEIGPQDGSGELTGSIESGTVSIGLNPDMADNNVFLRGTYEPAGGLNGEWTFVGFPGILNKGTFNAYRSDNVSYRYN